ncbi:hypothetical protein BC829DRAFT_449029 [Chytridium lagenaria]|nr:hypothetical protein BC829DRAFT_449029 [Chytridium lagenaria]
MRRRRTIEEDEDESDDASSCSSEEEGCDICKGHGTLILCDECYKPGTQVPEGDWLCDRCADSVPLSDIGIDPGDGPIRVDNVLSTLGKPCNLCLKLSQQVTKDSALNVIDRIVQTAGHLTPARNKSAKNSPHLLLCSSHAKDREATSIQGVPRAPSSVSTAQKRKRADGEPEADINEGSDDDPTKERKDDVSTLDAKRSKPSTPLESKPDVVKKTAGIFVNASSQTVKSSAMADKGNRIKVEADGYGISWVEIAESCSVPEKVVLADSDNMMRLLEKISQDVKTLVQTQKNQRAPPQQSTSGLDQLMDQSFGIIEKSKANREDEVRALQAEIRSLQTKISDRDMALATLRKDLVTIFGLLKLSSKPPEEQKIDEYIGIRNLPWLPIVGLGDLA